MAMGKSPTKTRRRAGIALALLSIAVVSGAQAAELTPHRGEILVNSGAGYRVTEGMMELKSGDAIFARPQSHASLIYGDGCAIDIAPGSVVWVRPSSPCTALGGPPPAHDPEPALTPRVTFDRDWLRDGAAQINRRKPPAGP